MLREASIWWRCLCSNGPTCFLVGGLVAIFYYPNFFPYIGNNPNWLIFFRGVETTNQLHVSLGSEIRRRRPYSWMKCSSNYIQCSSRPLTPDIGESRPAACWRTACSMCWTEKNHNLFWPHLFLSPADPFLGWIWSCPTATYHDCQQ